MSFAGKAYRHGPDTVEEVLGVVLGPNGILMACFLTGAPVEMTGIMNEVLQVQAADASAVSDKAKPCKRKREECTERGEDPSAHRSLMVLCLSCI